MARIRISDLPKDMKITRQELKRIRGGAMIPLLGESTDAKHKNEIEINKEIDKSTPYLY